MSDKNSHEIIIESFVRIDDKKKNFIFACLDYYKSVELNNLSHKYLTKKEIKTFKELRNLIVDQIIKNKKERTIIKQLLEAGFTKDQSQTFYDFCQYISEPLSDAKHLKKLDIETYKNLVNFFIHQVFIYKDYKNYFSDCSEISSFKRSKHSDEVMRFLHHQISEVLDRTISPNTLKLLLEFDFKIPQEMIDILYQALIDNMHELHMSHLYNQISDISEKVETMSTFFDEIRESDEEEKE